MVPLCKQVLVVEEVVVLLHPIMCKQCKQAVQAVQPVQPGASGELEVVVHPIINLQPFNSSHLQAAAHLGDKYAGC